MSAINRLIAAGFLVELVPPDDIGTTTVERLTDLQHQWVKAHFDNERLYR